MRRKDREKMEMELEDEIRIRQIKQIIREVIGNGEEKKEIKSKA
jgi:hypothetical protein